MRLFVAVALPQPLLALVEALPRPERAQVRWTTRPQWHITLRFLGEASPEPVVDALRTAVDRCEPPADVAATVGPNTAWFPGRRVLQVPVDGLEVLADFVTRATAAWGTQNESAYTGHLTLARTAGRSRGPADLAGETLSASFEVTEFGLYSSRTTPSGAVYTRLALFPLSAPGSDPPATGSRNGTGR